MSDMKTKTTSAWITHVKKFAQENNLKYNEALKDPNLKVGYVKVERVKKTKEPKMEPIMEATRTSLSSIEPPMKVKKERKKKDVMVVMEAPPIMIQTESGDLQQVVELPKKVRAKRPAKKKEPVMM
jgi:hypothetical protein